MCKSDINKEVAILKSYIENCRRTLFLNGDNISEKSFNTIKSFLLKVDEEDREGPDMYAQIDDKVLGIEHFEFNASGAFANKGMKQRPIINDIKNQKNEIGEIDASLENYLKNFEYVVGNHYLKIDKSKENLKKYSHNPIEICFFIEDTSEMGSSFKKDDIDYWFIQVNLFWDIINKYKDKINYIVYTSKGTVYNNHKKKMYFIDLSTEYDAVCMKEENFRSIDNFKFSC